jgi:hypothetical protein
MGVSSLTYNITPLSLTLLSKVAALKGYENANAIALDLWEEIYPDGLLFALTDTFSTGRFFKARFLAYLGLTLA